MPQRYDVVTIGSMVRDVTMFTNLGQVFKTPGNVTVQRVIGFEYGAKIIAPQAYFGLGGGAANVAVSLHKLGVSAALISRVGADAEGEHLRDDLRRLGLATEWVQRDPARHSALSFIIASTRAEHDHVIFHYHAAIDGLRVDPAVILRLRPRWIYVAALSGEHWPRNVKQIFAAAARLGAKVAWNPGSQQLTAGRQALERYLRHTTVLQVNKDEAIELALSGITLGKRNPSFLNKPLYLLNILSDWGPKIVVITDGPRGAYALADGKVYRHKAVRRKVADTTGVGDAFGAGVVAALIERKGDITEALRWGSLNAASVVTKIGAQGGILSRAELQAQIKRRGGIR